LGTLSQSNYNAIREHFVADYSIGYVLVVDPHYLQYPTDNIKDRLLSLLYSGTDNLLFTPQKTLIINAKPYTLYAITITTGSELVNSLASVVTNHLTPILIDRADPYFAHTIL
jgi:hypothetical protein